MIKNRMKKLGAFAIAAMMAVSVAPAMAAPAFAAEDDADAAIAEEMVSEDIAADEMDEAVPEEEVQEVQPEEIQQDTDVQEESMEEQVPDTSAVPQSVSENAAASSDSAAGQVKANATSLSLGAEYTGTLAAGGSKEFTFTTSSRDSYYEITLINASIDGNLYGYLYDNKSVKIDNVTGISKNHRSSFDYLFDGEKMKPNTKYTVKIEAPYTSKSGKYTIIIKEIYDDMGNSYDKAKVISTGTIGGKIEVNRFDDSDWMKFTVPSTGKYRITLTNKKSDGTVGFQFYDKYAAKMDYDFGYNSIFENRAGSRDCTFTQGNVYYIEISSFYVTDYVFSIQKLKNANTMTAKGLTKKVKKSKLKKKAQKVKAISVKNAKGTLTYKKVSGSKKLSVNKKTGKVTVKKNTKKGKYTMKVKVTAAGNGAYYAKSKTVKVTVKVK